MSKWWLEKPMRLIQTNLREIDANLDVEEYITSLKDFSADVVLFNVGGIVANYPTDLEFHYKNPYMQGDFLGNVITRAHKEGIRLIARFDFSRLNEEHANQHPEWLYKSIKGEHVNYNGQVHTCLNGYYQQEYSIKIMREAARKYPIDGVFINMHGYVTHDYSYHYHGICQCNNCQQRFYERFGHKELPIEENGNDSVFRDYEKFKEETIRELFIRRSNAVKNVNENIAICNYTHDGTDIFRKESNTGIDRALPESNYSASQNVKSVLGSWDHMAVSNSAVHFVDFAQRHSAVSPHLTSLRLAQDLIHGGWLDYYVIGTLNNQDDRICFEQVKEIYDFHKKNEKYYTDIQSTADVCLISPESSSFYGSMKEYQGLFRILSEAHILFDVIHDSVLENSNAYKKLKKYKIAILPDLRNMSLHSVRVIDQFVRTGGRVLATGESSTCNSQGHPLEKVQLNCLGIKSIHKLVQKQGTYFRIRDEDKAVLKGFENLDLIYLYGEFIKCEVEKGGGSFLGYIPPVMFGPPEKCYATTETDHPGLIYNEFGKGKGAYIPWQIGRHYQKLSHHGHALLIQSILQNLLDLDKSLSVEASPLVEVTSQKEKEGKRQLVSLANLSGQLGTAFLPPVPIYNINVKLKVDQKPRRVYCLKLQEELDFSYTTEGIVTFSVPKLELFETIVLSMES